ncbi:MAG: SAM-dependent methyltransferase [Anaerolineaceae bacterium]|nr:SAM-dependent methyltransferase [Anaerolineaceae bacterium]
MDDRLQQQINYYRARAGEYDEWFYRIGRYDHGQDLNQQWFSEAQQVMDQLHGIGPVDDVLELACGTGIWTEQLHKIAGHITALDASPEVIAINKAKLNADNVTYGQVDLFNWEPDRQYDLVFFGFWLSHVPPDKLMDFLQKVARAVRPGGHLFIVDSRRAIASSAKDHIPYADTDVFHTRKLNDGSEYVIYKVFYEPQSLRHKLSRVGFEADVSETGHYFLYAHAIRR